VHCQREATKSRKVRYTTDRVLAVVPGSFSNGTGAWYTIVLQYTVREDLATHKLRKPDAPFRSINLVSADNDPRKNGTWVFKYQVGLLCGAVSQPCECCTKVFDFFFFFFFFDEYVSTSPTFQRAVEVAVEFRPRHTSSYKELQVVAGLFGTTGCTSP
jgi:hypothetical protein